MEKKSLPEAWAPDGSLPFELTSPLSPRSRRPPRDGRRSRAGSRPALSAERISQRSAGREAALPSPGKLSQGTPGKRFDFFESASTNNENLDHQTSCLRTVISSMQQVFSVSPSQPRRHDPGDHWGSNRLRGAVSARGLLGPRAACTQPLVPLASLLDSAPRLSRNPFALIETRHEKPDPCAYRRCARRSSPDLLFFLSSVAASLKARVSFSHNV
jgi:hypothetical protein